MDITKEVESAIPELMQRIKADALKEIERRAVAEATDAAVRAAREWAVDVLAPEIKAQLEAGKEGMVAAARDAAKKIGDAFGDALAEHAEKALKNSYTTKQIAELMFRGY